jgi:hypothetical protein
MEKLHNNLIAFKLEGPGIKPTGGEESVHQLESIISSVIGIMTIVGVIYFTIQIILAGYSLIASHGDPKELQTGTKRLTNGVMGLAIIVLAYGLGALITNLLGMSNVFDLTKVLKPF